MTPMMMQWHTCKQEAKGALLLFRLGDFYEAFYDDAEVLAKELDLTLTKRQEIPMSGVPFHTCEGYVDRLVAKGYRVAIAEQMEDPRAVKGIVKREITRMVTPGTVINSSLLAEKSNNYLASVVQINASFGLALLDLTTGEYRAMEFLHREQLEDELFRLAPAELLIPDSLSWEGKAHRWEKWHFNEQGCLDLLLSHFRVHSLDGFGLKGMNAAICAAGALLSYVRDELNLPISHIVSLKKEELHHTLALDRAAHTHLEIDALRELLDQTSTPMGGRLLKQWVAHPLLSPREIEQRQDALSNLLEYPLDALRKSLSSIRDLERLIMRISTGFALPRDLVALRYSLEELPRLAEATIPLTASLLTEQRSKLADLSPLATLIRTQLVDTPPLRASEGGLFRDGVHSELDTLRLLKTDSTAWVVRYQEELRQKTGIKTLKVGFTQAFGYYIEVSRGQSDRVPPEFQRKQTLVNAERFITPELKEFETKILHAEEKATALELHLFQELKAQVSTYSADIRSTAQAVAHLDVLVSLASIAKTQGYVRPLVNETQKIEIRGGRHPVIEPFLAQGAFVPNDVLLDTQKNTLLLITGPNMAGKSTYIRQVALLVILAQMGSFIPAEQAEIGIVDKIFTRIGASDNLQRGQSTFMVEMTETANILHNATSRSLVILDEIGRGTSTYDGIAIAWSVCEHLLLKTQCKTLFATHYWELTKLEQQLPGAINAHVAVHEGEDGIVFLHKIVKGSTDKSYGIHVARLAGLPDPVITRAREILSKWEKPAPLKIKPHTTQPDLFA